MPLRASPVRYSRLSAHPADIKTHPRASPPLPERKLREAHSRSMLMLLRNVARCDRLAAIPPKADIRIDHQDVRFVPKADILRCSKERRYSITSSARASSCGSNSFETGRKRRWAMVTMLGSAVTCPGKPQKWLLVPYLGFRYIMGCRRKIVYPRRYPRGETKKIADVTY